MNTGQMLLTTAALILLGVTVLTVNRNSLQSGTILRQTELGVYAISLATSYLEKAGGLNFDANTVTGGIVNESELTYPCGLEGTQVTGGTEYANKDSTFDDFDDYHNFNKIDAVAGVDSFRVKAVVYYVDPLVSPYSVNVSRAYRTRFKRIDLKVVGSSSRSVFEDPTSKTGKDTINMSYVFSFFK